MISPCGSYRYQLRRQWEPNKPVVAFIGLNPSIADAHIDDPTIRRCMGYARSWGYGSVIVANLFAYRATIPAIMMTAAEPHGPDNAMWLRRTVSEATVVIAAWGNDGRFKGAADELVKSSPIDLYHLRLTKSGQPAHPLYLPKDLKPQLWVRPSSEGGNQ